jgi:hypothetical protein
VGYLIDDWNTFWQAIINGHRASRLQPKNMAFCQQFPLKK